MITENSTGRTQAKAFSFFSVAGNIGIFLGPPIGRPSLTLSSYSLMSFCCRRFPDSTVNYPSIFEHMHLFKTYPYLLPTLITGCVAASATVLLYVSAYVYLGSYQVAVVIYLTGHMALIALGYTADLTSRPFVLVYIRSGLDSGGLGFTPLQISFPLDSQHSHKLSGFSPSQHSNVDTEQAVFFVLGWTTAFWIMMPSVQFLGAAVSLVFTAMQLALNDVAPAPNTLGTLNAIFLTLNSGLRAVAPGVFSSVFAVGVRTQVLGGQLIWVIIVCLTIGFWAGVRYLPEKAEGRTQTSNRQA
ncbi:Major facilitator superfamily transporter [Mycena venus]|uniref:Major facilitator superfamily transporter n=1 Tax=Mycena venus TaxID=2733690 RepID=A0A8H6XX07_9AGAR|nr:Major facilitator superfamily transporter [Mycena venus]